MRLANIGGRAVLVGSDGYYDVEEVTRGHISADPMSAIERISELKDWHIPLTATPLHPRMLDPPVPRPSKILGAGINYHTHLAEAGFEPPTEPVLFAKLPSALCGPTSDVIIPEDRLQVDWEAELVVVIGKRARRIPESDALSVVAGYSVGQDISDREEQFRSLRQFTMGKSFDSYAPMGPVLVTPDEIGDINRLSVRCWINGEIVQDGNTNDWIFGVPRLISWISRICTLEPGDLIFTGTPAGVGYIRTPPRFLRPGMILDTEIEALGKLTNHCVQAPVLAQLMGS
jgi:2,4-didehydro-3-deoxy-L-rhamnonate hydrolase